MLITVGVLAGLLVALGAAVGGAGPDGAGTSTLTLAAPYASAGELLILDEGSELEETVVVQRVMTDRTLSHVVLVRPFQRWHR